MHLDPKALEQAVRAVFIAMMAGENDYDAHAAIAIRTYLAGVMPTEVSDLVAKLERLNPFAEDMSDDGPEASSQAMAEAARALALLFAELQSLKGDMTLISDTVRARLQHGQDRSQADNVFGIIGFLSTEYPLASELDAVKAEYAEFVKQHEKEVGALSASIPADIGELVERSESSDPDKFTAWDRLRVHAATDDYDFFDTEHAAEILEWVNEAASALRALSAELATVKGERDEAVNWNTIVETHGTDQFDDLADAWLALPAIQRTTNAAISTFAKWANDELMARFKTNQLSMFHLAFVEGCMAGVKAAEAKLAGGEAVVDREVQIKHMVKQFLRWRLPEGFSPDGGISFQRTYQGVGGNSIKCEPVGTNLFDYSQATEMVRHMLDGLPAHLTHPAPTHNDGRGEAVKGPTLICPKGDVYELTIDQARRAMAAALSPTAADDETESPYEWLACEFDRMAILRKMWTAHEVAAIIRRHDIHPSALTHPAPTHEDGSGDVVHQMQAALAGLVRLIDVIHAENADKGHILPSGPTVTEARRLADLRLDTLTPPHTSGAVTEAIAALAKLRELVTEHGAAAQSKANGRRGYRKFAHIRLDMHKIIDDLEAFLQGDAS